VIDRPFTINTRDGTIGAWRGEGTAGPLAVLLHGGPGMSASYLDPLTDLLADVFSTVSYQQRGLPPTTIREPYTVEANVADAVAVIDQVAGERAWIVGHSWGGHLALHMLAACPERLEGAIIVDPLGAYLEVFEEFGERMTAPLSDAQRARAQEIDAKEERGEATPEESREALSLVWPSYFADPAAAPQCPDIALDVATFAGTMASVREHEQAGTLTRRLPDVPSSTPVLFVHGAKSPLPVRTTTMTAELIPHARVEILPAGGHFPWHEDPAGTYDTIARFVAGSASLPA
jgi:pimeloyl-ACP methyl ester carboxylesterase